MFKLLSPAFQKDEEIPSKYTGEGEDYSPPLKWMDVPSGTKELVLVCDDPDAPASEPWVHWIVYGLSPTATNGLAENLPKDKSLSHPLRAIQGRNSFGEIGYMGPMPPMGHGIHRYFFKLYALDVQTNLDPGLTKSEILPSIQGHVIGETQLMGKYERSSRVKRAS
jgi:Raf kinase inhibitor-like YbhB/YbcL family protein